MNNHCGYYRRCLDEPHEGAFVYADFRHHLSRGLCRVHFDMLQNEPVGVVFEGMTYIRASPEQELRVLLYHSLRNQ